MTANMPFLVMGESRTLSHSDGTPLGPEADVGETKLGADEFSRTSWAIEW